MLQTGAARQAALAAPACAPHGRRAVIMRAVQFRPCIDIHKGKVKQIVGSTLQDLQSDGEAVLKTNFEAEQSSSWFAELYQEDGLTGGHVIMLGADEASRSAALGALGAYPGGLQLGGGVTTENAREWLDAGASHVIVTSFIFRDGKLEEERLADLVKLVGKERLVLDLSCRKKEDGKYYVVTDRWQKFSSLALSQETLGWLAQSCDEFLVHGVDVEGMQLGIDDELVELLGAWSPIPVTYAGGARTLEDLERVRRAGRGRVDITVGSALDIFGGELPYADVVAWHRRQQEQAGQQVADVVSGSAAPVGDATAAGGSGPGGAPAGRPGRRSKALGELMPDGSIMYRDIANMYVPQRVEPDGTTVFSFE